MNDQLEDRLKVLESEFENGKKMLAELEARETALRSSLLRISGAIQVLREFVPKAADMAHAMVEEEPHSNSVTTN